MKSLINRFLWLLSRLWMFCGVATIVVGLGFGVYNIEFLSQAMSAIGTIQSLAPVENKEDNTVNYAPVFLFADRDGRSYTITSSVSSNPPGFTVGQTVRVLYQESNPANAKLDYFWQLWFVTILCLALGAFFSGAGYVLFRYERRQKLRSAIATSQAGVDPR